MPAPRLLVIEGNTPENRARVIAGIPLGRLGQPEDMGGVALFLASPLAAYVVGQTIPVDGGLIIA